MANGLAPIVAVLATVALFLSGCGGSGHTCANQNFDIKSQSFKGKTTSTLAVDGTKYTLDGGEVVVKFDIDKVNLRLDITEGGDTISLNTKMFFSTPKKLFATRDEVTVDGKTNSTCAVVDFSKLTEFPSPEEASLLLKTLISEVKGRSPCKSNDGTYDTFGVDVQIPKDLPIPLPQNLSSLKAETNDQLQCDSNYMLHSASGSVDVSSDAPVNITANGTTITIPKGTVHADTTLTVDGGVAQTGGPTDADLDYKSWGKCAVFQPTKIPKPPSMKASLKASRSDALGKTSDALKLRLQDPTSSHFVGLVVTAVDDLLQKLSQPASTVVV